ncbi:MAG: hypothetical protein EOO94_00465 [Pedobacter sp.]|nr:MAG: hypothetical protein EOO94_00465 [Pedobacter sp.]
MYDHSQRSIAEQTVNNATSWIGHRNFDDKDVVAGQTFVAGAGGDLETIEVFTSVITKPGKILMTVYDFDEQHNQWGASLGSASVAIGKDSHDSWLPFPLKGLHLDKGKSYGFKLESDDTYIGVGEAAGSAHHPPLESGKEWKFENKNHQPHSFRYFSLAFKVGVKAA